MRLIIIDYLTFCGSVSVLYSLSSICLMKTSGFGAEPHKKGTSIGEGAL